MSAVTIGSNIASLKAQQELGKTTSQISDIYEHLSSGQRINKASDDAAGLAVASALNSNKRVYIQGVRNLNDGISLLNIADGSLAQLSQITLRLKELAEQAANGIYATQQRNALDNEAQALSQEYTRIAQSTGFNGLHLFSASSTQIRLQGGYGIDGGIQCDLSGLANVADDLSSSTSQSVTVGTGTFNAASSSVTPSTNGSYAIALGDLNGDGILDIVTGGIGSANGEADVRLGAGDGSFGAAVSYDAEFANTNTIALADLNKDGILDLVTAGRNLSSGQATVRLGRGDGSFGTATSYATEAYTSYGVSLGDLNGDGVIDLVTTGYGAGQGRATVRLGNGDGSFGGAVSYALGISRANDISLGDLNGDGVLDIAIAGKDYTTGGNAMVLLGSGDGSFGAAVSYGYGFNILRDISLGDLNGDHILDLVTAGYDQTAAGYAAVRLGRGDGSFGAAISYTTEVGASNDVSLGDLNGDGFLDLITAGYGAGFHARATVRLGRGDGSFGTATSFLTGDDGTQALALGDLNGDGVLDIATAGYHFSGSPLDSSSILISQTTSQPGTTIVPFTLTTSAGALLALTQFSTVLDSLSSERGVIGSYQSRINTAANVLQVTAENFQAAASRITDSDVAAESANLVRTQILQQAGAAVLAQANQQPALALQLLR